MRMPTKRSGRIRAASPHDSDIHSRESCVPAAPTTTSPATATMNAAWGEPGIMSPATTVAAAASMSAHGFRRYQSARSMASTPLPMAASDHLCTATQAAGPVEPDACQLTSARMAIIRTMSPRTCEIGRCSGSSGMASDSSARTASSLRKMTCMISPMTMLNAMAPTARAMPMCAPSTRAVMKMATTLMAGPA